MSIFIFLLLSSSISRNVCLVDSLLSDISFVTLACSVLLFSSRRVEILSSLLIVTEVVVFIVFPIASRVLVFGFCLGFFLYLECLVNHQ